MKGNVFNRKEAIALSYNEKALYAPKVVAKGKGMIADRIVETAKAHNVPIQEDNSLVELLGQLDLNESVPEELYNAVAEVFAFLYRMDQFAKK
ncbi:flagellar biosynthesis protein [Bacillus pakistanensis]|uniref:Flagellar biosynthesis protein n=1 Tax=Rossellomorea pakistanensis TaxID=992288 RepID=A0ABS2NG23_9BACI|nr:EscU/YscU/HrcU family type III secretion system export apparatus switch protein [Bacillus pakistanensis]MBM7586816.1 flagellar biosynthesis protein [Bacillus pakistanensis]